MDLGWFRFYQAEYVKQAIKNSDGTNAGIIEYLRSIKPAGRLASHRVEKNHALAEVLKAFDEHRHWPLAIILSYLGIEK
jgi:hypothetical protein